MRTTDKRTRTSARISLLPLLAPRDVAEHSTRTLRAPGVTQALPRRQTSQMQDT